MTKDWPALPEAHDHLDEAKTDDGLDHEELAEAIEAAAEGR